jgi:hypothetical protein
LELDVTDAETVRAAAEVLRSRRPTWTATQYTLGDLADGIEAEDAATLKAAERDQRLGLVARQAYNHPTSAILGDDWIAVARAVREAIEAES